VFFEKRVEPPHSSHVLHLTFHWYCDLQLFSSV
jgi:hypothetical protein